MSPRLAELARAAREPAAPGPAAQGPAREQEERCDLCSEPIAPKHRHLLDTGSRELICVCQACSILFDRKEASEGHYRLIPDRGRRLEDFRLDDALWDGLRIPVDLAFFFHSSQAGRVVAYYPGPMGATESLLELEDWERLERANPVLREMEPDVEALLVNRARGADEQWLVPLDECYALTAVFRLRWKGLGGGSEVWEAVREFFDDKEERWQR